MNAGRVFVVTGAAGGIGQALVRRLLAERAVVWAVDRTVPPLKELQQEASQRGWQLRVHAADVTSEQALVVLSEKIVSQDQKVDVWVNNAGLAGEGDFERTPSDRFFEVVNVNLMGVVHGTRAALRCMQARGEGCIVNMASVAGVVPAPFLAAYCASKGAVISFTRALSEELRLKNSPVRLFLILPGFVDTKMTREGKLRFPQWLQWILSSPDQVSEAILEALRTDQREMTPTWNGAWLRRMHAIFPQTTRRSARILLAPSFRDWILNRYTVD